MCTVAITRWRFLGLPSWEGDDTKFPHSQLPTTSCQEGGDGGGWRDGGGRGRQEDTGEMIVERSTGEECGGFGNGHGGGKKG